MASSGPVQQWNKGKKSEFSDRRVYLIKETSDESRNDYGISG